MNRRMVDNLIASKCELQACYAAQWTFRVSPATEKEDQSVEIRNTTKLAKSGRSEQLVQDGGNVTSS